MEHIGRLRAEKGTHLIRRRFISSGLWRSIAASVLTLVLAMGVLVGVADAADSARPGDLLYPIDRGVENLQVRLVSAPDRKLTLLVSFADERLVEIQQLIETNDEENMSIALDAYRITILTIAQIITDEFARHDLLVTKIDNQLLAQEEHLQKIRLRVPAQARPALDRAIETIRIGHEKILLPDDDTESTNPPVATPTPEYPSDSSGNGPAEPPVNVTAGPPSNVTAGPPVNVTAGPPSNVTAGPPHGVPAERPTGTDNDP
ncbi:MAG TPA: DUF5667 domain-containing protein [Anaerolineales bacterium]|nr:DUF5667 domain-containing protein [Anaerolineales bacterium]